MDNSMKDRILGAAYLLARSHGYLALTRDGVATKAGVSAGLVNHYFGTVQNLRNEVVQRAVTEEYLPLIAQAFAHQDQGAMEAPEGLIQRAIAAVGGDL